MRNERTHAHTHTHTHAHEQANKQTNVCMHIDFGSLGSLTLASSLGSSAFAGDKEKRLGREVNHPGLAVANLDSSDFTLPWMMSRALPAMLNALQPSRQRMSLCLLQILQMATEEQTQQTRNDEGLNMGRV